MRKKKRLLLHIFGFLIFLSIFLYALFFIPPTAFYHVKQNFINLTFSSSLLFFSTLFLWIMFLFSILLNNTRRGVVIGIIITSFFLLRFFSLNNPIFILLVIGFFVVLELVFINRRE